MAPYLQWIFKHLHLKNAFQNVVCKTAGILSQPPCVQLPVINICGGLVRAEYGGCWVTGPVGWIRWPPSNGAFASLSWSFWKIFAANMMTSSNGNIFRVTGLCEGSPVTAGFPSQRPVTRSFDVFFDLRLNKRLSKQSRRRWLETPSRSSWHHCNDMNIL